MKVLKKGTGQKAWAIKRKCTGSGNGGGGCGAQLLVEKGDVFQTESNPMGRDLQTFNTFECPSCKVLTDLPESVTVPGEHEGQIPTMEAWMKRRRRRS